MSLRPSVTPLPPLGKKHSDYWEISGFNGHLRRKSARFLQVYYRLYIYFVSNEISLKLLILEGEEKTGCEGNLKFFKVLTNTPTKNIQISYSHTCSYRNFIKWKKGQF